MILALLLLLSGCDQASPQEWSACADSACRQRWVSDHWEHDHKAVGEAIAGLPDPVERSALVRQLTLAHPGEAAPLCDLLVGPVEQQGCRDRNQRPHLKDIKVDKSSEAAPAQDEESTGLPLTGALPSPWTTLLPDTVSCSAEQRVCQADEARARAAAGRLEAAAAACLAIPDPQWQAECFFQAAEAAGHNPGRAGGEAVSLCLGSSSYTARCLSHLVRQLGTTAPPASSLDRGRWSALSEAITAGTAILAPANAELARAFEGQAWAYALRFAYVDEGQPDGAPLDALPEAAAPHVRAAVAWRMWSLNGQDGWDLATWKQKLAQALADRSAHPQPGGPAPPRTNARQRDLWQKRLPGEEALTAVPFLGPVQRALSTDPATDAEICLLENAARGRPLGAHLLEQALGEPDPLVRWTAARLLSAVAPKSPVLAQHQDADPLVRGRLLGG